MTLTRTTSNGLESLQIVNEHAEALVYLHGAHVAHFQPRGQRPVLWMSASSVFQEGKPIRGGVPLCAPWFGPHPTDATLPAHGVIRQRAWTLQRHEVLADGTDRLELRLVCDATTSPATRLHPFSASLVVTFGRELALELSIRNTGTEPLLLGEALHTYLSVSDVRSIRITGLEAVTFLDKMDGGARKIQEATPLAITAQTDRVYFSETDVVVVEDPGFSRRIRVTKSGSGATVVWNPWVEKAASMPDFGDNEWTHMVCIEAANAADSILVVPPNFTHHLRQGIAIEIPGLQDFVRVG